MVVSTNRLLLGPVPTDLKVPFCVSLGPLSTGILATRANLLTRLNASTSQRFNDFGSGFAAVHMGQALADRCAQAFLIPNHDLFVLNEGCSKSWACSRG